MWKKQKLSPSWIFKNGVATLNCMQNSDLMSCNVIDIRIFLKLNMVVAFVMIENNDIYPLTKFRWYNYFSLLPRHGLVLLLQKRRSRRLWKCKFSNRKLCRVVSASIVYFLTPRKRKSGFELRQAVLQYLIEIIVVRQALAIIRYLGFYITGNLVAATENRDGYVCMRVSSKMTTCGLGMC